MTFVEIYTDKMCPFCHRAKKLLHQKAVDYKEINVTADAKTRRAMSNRAGGRTSVPQIFINGDHIGGCDDLYALERAGKLDAKLTAAA
jgi:glutaredoxin 3